MPQFSETLKQELSNFNPAGTYNPEDLSLKQIDLLIENHRVSIQGIEFVQKDCERWLDSPQKQSNLLRLCEEMNTLLQWQVMLLTWRANIKARELKENN